MIRLQEIADRVQGELRGNGETRITGIASLESAKKGDITFLLAESHEGLLATSRASAVIVGRTSRASVVAVPNAIVVDNPEIAYAKAAALFEPALQAPRGISPGAYLSDSASVADSAAVFPYVYVGDGAVIEKNVVLFPFSFIGNRVHVGEGTVIRPHVSVYDGTVIGKRVIVHSGAVLGSDGFRYVWDGKGHRKVPQLGIVIIEDDVEIGANACIDRASLDATIVRAGTKIDNQVQIAHNVVIGENSIMAAQVGIAGSTTVGRGVYLGGQAGVTGHIQIGDQVMAAGGAGITKSVPAKTVVAGNPHMAHREWLKLQVYLRKLPGLFERISKIEKLLQGVKNDRD